MTRRYVLFILFKLFDLTLLVGSLVAASVTSLRTVSGDFPLTEFLAMKISVRQHRAFSRLW